MSQSWLRCCVAAWALMAVVNCYGQVDTLAVRGNMVYFTEQGALKSWKIGAPGKTQLQASGWPAKNKIAIKDGQIYFTDSGNLCRKQLSNLGALPTLVNANGWDADSFCMANGYAYWSYNGNLFEWDMIPSHNHSRIGTTMVSGDARVVVDGTDVYWVKGDDLMKAPLSNVDGGATTANPGGWKKTGRLAAYNGVLYFTSGGGLYKTSLSSISGSPAIDQPGW